MSYIEPIERSLLTDSMFPRKLNDLGLMQEFTVLMAQLNDENRLIENIGVLIELCDHLYYASINQLVYFNNICIRFQYPRINRIAVLTIWHRRLVNYSTHIQCGASHFKCPRNDGIVNLLFTEVFSLFRNSTTVSRLLPCTSVISAFSMLVAPRSKPDSNLRTNVYRFLTFLHSRVNTAEDVFRHFLNFYCNYQSKETHREYIFERKYRRPVRILDYLNVDYNPHKYLVYSKAIGTMFYHRFVFRHIENYFQYKRKYKAHHLEIHYERFCALGMVLHALQPWFAYSEDITLNHYLINCVLDLSFEQYITILSNLSAIGSTRTNFSLC